MSILHYSHFPSHSYSNTPFPQKWTALFPQKYFGQQLVIIQEYHVVIGPDAKHLSEVAEGHRGVCFEPEVSIVVCRCQVTTLTAGHKQRSTRLFSTQLQSRLAEVKYPDPVCTQGRHTFHFLYKLIHRYKLTRGRRCSPPPQSPAAAHLFQVFDLSCLSCAWCLTG